MMRPINTYAETCCCGAAVEFNTRNLGDAEKIIEGWRKRHQHCEPTEPGDDDGELGIDTAQLTDDDYDHSE